MVGRSGWCLLAVLLQFQALTYTGAQSSQPKPRVRIAPDSVLRVPHLSRPPIEMVPHTPRFPGTSLGTLGFPEFVRAAGMIFSGTVVGIERRPANSGQSVETVAITFHIEDAIRGTAPASDLTIRQWIGLWSSGQRYRLGERILVFLYPNSKLGLTSCVGGPMGRFAIDPAGRVLLTAQHVSAFRRDPVLGGKSRVRFSDFTQAVRQASEEE